ncbi:MAG: hypothetical protein R3F31_20410 [Verrucomicrobiales bacterium]
MSRCRLSMKNVVESSPSCLSEVQRRLGLTVIHVTHSRGEAPMLADLVYRLSDGSLKEEPGTWLDLFTFLPDRVSA